MSAPSPDQKASTGPHAAETRPCVICGKPQQSHIRPFCSSRCANIDLGRWLKGTYSIPGGPAEDSDSS